MTLSKERKIRKAEINRRFFSNEFTIDLPEDEIYNNELFKENDFKIFKTLAQRMFFVKLEETVAKNGCDGTLKLAESLLLEMNYKTNLIDIKKVLEENGGYCSCEILYNIYPKLYIDSLEKDIETY